ncbi:response regulator [Alteromonas sediminis]|uniref:Sensory/regulatory protein RpfC n=1 Tax=Alteromonas sediminis TaxID=2259342 RepID=A0A3N5XWD9_9ALTE|nr:ATP-binding protein [Alteromonas sediminis]RPJ64912.1 response regulator [Alteromonas sediminis]
MSGEVSLQQYLLKTALPRQATILFALFVLLGTLFYFYSQPQIEARHQQDLVRLDKALEAGLQATLNQMRNLAANDFVVNSLVDMDQQQYYLTLFFQSLRINNDDTASIGFFNFEGEIIASKNVAPLNQVLNTTHWKKDVLEAGSELILINGKGVTLAVPVFLSENLVEGALIFYSPYVGNLIRFEQGTTKQAIVDSEGYVLFATENADLTIGKKLESGVLEDNISRIKTTNDLRLVSFESYAQAYTAVVYLLPFLLLTLFFALVSNLSSTLSVAKMGAETLSRLQLRIKSGFDDKQNTNRYAIKELISINEAFEHLKDEVMSLSLTNDRVTGVIDALLELMLVIDNDNKLVLSNRACREFMQNAHIEEQYLIDIAVEFSNLSQQDNADKLEKCYALNSPQERKIIEWYVTPLIDENGKTRGQVIVGEDVTVRKSLESDLLLKTQAVDRASASILISDLTKKDEPIIYVNKACETLTGYSEDEFIGKNCRFLQGPETNPEVVQNIRSAINKREPVDVTLLNYRKDGTEFYNHLSLTPIKNDDGSCTHYLGIQQDVTASTQAAQYLQDAKNKAEESSRMKASFLANMSHEIRTPINGVYGVLQLLEATKLNDKQSGFVQMAIRSTKSLLHIVNDILDLSKIEAGKLDIEKVYFVPEPFFEEIGDTYALLAKEKGLVFESHIRLPVDTYVCGDPTRIRQVLENLLSNAIKFTSSGQIEVYVSLSMDSGDGALIFSVKDTGVGISEEKIQHIFDHFSQEDLSTTRQFGGTGLGLAITKQLCELMGGSVKTVSQKGQGSVFAVTIPVHIASNPQVIAQSSNPKGTSSIINKATIHVLLVEDNEINQTVAKSHLDGYQVTVCDNGQAAIDILATSGSHFDVVLMDCQMPIMDGFEATKNIRNGSAGDAARQIPIIALTANAMKGDRDLCVAAGMDDYISKPFESSELLSAVNKWASIKRQ